MPALLHLKLVFKAHFHFLPRPGHQKVNFQEQVDLKNDPLNEILNEDPFLKQNVENSQVGIEPPIPNGSLSEADNGNTLWWLWFIVIPILLALVGLYLLRRFLSARGRGNGVSEGSAIASKPSLPEAISFTPPDKELSSEAGVPQIADDEIELESLGNVSPFVGNDEYVTEQVERDHSFDEFALEDLEEDEGSVGAETRPMTMNQGFELGAPANLVLEEDQSEQEDLLSEIEMEVEALSSVEEVESKEPQPETDEGSGHNPQAEEEIGSEKAVSTSDKLDESVSVPPDPTEPSAGLSPDEKTEHESLVQKAKMKITKLTRLNDDLVEDRKYLQNIADQQNKEIKKLEKRFKKLVKIQKESESRHQDKIVQLTQEKEAIQLALDKQKELESELRHQNAKILEQLKIDQEKRSNPEAAALSQANNGLKSGKGSANNAGQNKRPAKAAKKSQ